MQRLDHILLASETARMLHHRPLRGQDADAERVGFQHQLGVAPFDRHRVAVGVDRDAELAGGALLTDGGDIEAVCRQRQQAGPLGLEELHGFFTGLAVCAHVGHRLQPGAYGRAERCKIRDLETCEEVFFDIADRVFHPALFVSPASFIRCSRS